MLYDFEVSQLKDLLFLQQPQAFSLHELHVLLLDQTTLLPILFCPSRLSSRNHELTKIKVWGGAETTKLMPLPQGCRSTRWSSSGSFPSKCCVRLCAILDSYRYNILIGKDQPIIYYLHRFSGFCCQSCIFSKKTLDTLDMVSLNISPKWGLCALQPLLLEYQTHD